MVPDRNDVESRGRWSARRRLPAALLRFSLGHPRTVLLLWAVVLLLGLPGVLRLSIDPSTDSLLEHGSAAWSVYQHSRETFGDDEVLVVALAGSRPLDPQRLAELGALTSTLEAVDGVRRVDSLFSVPLIRAHSDGTLELDPPLTTGAPLSEEARAHLEEDLAHDRIAPDSFLSQDRRTFSANVLLEPDLGPRYDEVVTRVQEVARGAGAWISGVPIFRTELSRAIARELALFVLLTTGVVGALLAAYFRSAAGVILPLTIGGIGTFLTVAAMGIVGRPIELSTMVLPSVMLALGCAYSMHGVTAASRGSAAGDLEAALEPVMLPVALSGLTTSVGFLGIAAVGIQGIQDTGGFGALGVFAITGASLTALPAALRLFPVPRREPLLSGWLRSRAHPWLVRTARQRSAAVLVAFAVVSAVSAFGLARVTLDTDTTRWFPRGHPIREAYEEIRLRLSGISPMNVVVASRDGRKVTAPDVLAAVDGLTRHLAAHPDVGKALSLADPLRQMHGGFQGDPSQPLPPTQAATEQYLLFLESVEQLRDLVTADRRRANVLLRVDDNSSAGLLALAREAEAWWGEHGPRDFDARTTGIMHEFARAEDAIAEGQVKGLSFAMAIIACVLLAIFRSPRLAGLALVPNLLPILLGFGAMGLARIPLDAGTAVMGSLALGIAVDDTVHVLAAYHRRRLDGSDAPKAIEGALDEVLPALVGTTLVVGAGFAVLGFSTLSFTRNLGLLVTAVLGLCLITDTVLLPALLARWDRRLRRS